MKKILILLCLSTAFGMINATPINKSEAFLTANQFITQTPNRKLAPGRSNLPTIESEPAYEALSISGKHHFFIFII